jgi:L-fuconolactonase
MRTNRLQLTVEDTIDPDLTICDAHHHLWYETDDRYTLEDYLQDIAGGHRIIQTVFVESREMLSQGRSPDMQPVGETEYIERIMSQSSRKKTGETQVAAGIVGFADLTLGSNVEPVLEAHIEAGKGRFRGIRHTCAWDPSPDIKSRWNIPKGLLLDTKFREGLACLRKHNLSFDAWLYYHQLLDLTELARLLPDLVIIVDHIGGPLGIGPYLYRREEVFHDWQEKIANLASCENVFLKLGGLGMANCGFGWNQSTIPPGSDELSRIMSRYYLWCVEKFGANRCMFESNFPVDKRSYSNNTLWNAFKKITRGFSASERQSLFYNTAARVYRLPPVIDLG